MHDTDPQLLHHNLIFLLHMSQFRMQKMIFFLYSFIIIFSKISHEIKGKLG